jgi:2-polyprenyl-6-hydroxyphenyl methylase/3-demethylubiquinone-9 3-methyltransferase
MTTDAIAYYAGVAGNFHDSYKVDPNRLERVRVWRSYFDRFAQHGSFGYDMGCGSGVLTCELARRGIEIIGIDGASTMLAIAKTFARDQNLGHVSFVQRLLPIRDTTGFRIADIIISSSALEYLDSMPDALGFLHRMLRPGGMLMFSVSNRDSISRKAVRLVHSLTGRPAYFGHLRQFMTVKSLRNDLESAGFTCVDHAYIEKAGAINRLLGTLLPARLASNMIIVAARRD